MTTDPIGTAQEAPSLGGDDLVMRLMYELHAHVPEEQRPMSMSDFSDEQAVRMRKAVHAVLTEWEGAKAALRSSAQPTPPIGTAQERELIKRLRLLALKANFPSTIDDLRAAADALLSRIAEVERLREAMRPFAEACGDCVGDEEPDAAHTWEHPIGMSLTIGDFRKAAALSQHRKL